MYTKLLKILLSLLGLTLALIWASPLYLLFVNSFKTQRDIFVNTLSLPKIWTFANYIAAADSLKIVSSFANSIFITVVSIIVIIVFSALAAYAMERSKSNLSTLMYLLFAGVILIPFQTVMIPLFSIFGDINIFNRLGLMTNAKVSMLNRTGLIFMYLGFYSSQAIFLYHGALKGIPKSLDEAAMIDGCSRFKTFWQIVFPNLKSITITIALLDVMFIWNDYLLPSLIINKEGMQTIPIRMFYFFGEYTKQWNVAMAGLTLAILPVTIFYFIAQKQIISGIMIGAIKQ